MIADGRGTAPLKVHALQRVHFEPPGSIEAWARHAGHALAVTHRYRGDPLPMVNDVGQTALKTKRLEEALKRDLSLEFPERPMIAQLIDSKGYSWGG